MASQQPQGKKRWFPLESNPDVMNKYVQNLGADTSAFAFTDIFGLDDEMLAFVPQPVKAILLVFPFTDENQKHRQAKVDACAAIPPSDKVFFLKQTVGNACGTIGLLHAISNTPEVNLADGFLKTLVTDFAGSTPDERAAFVAASDALEAAHTASASEGQSQLEDLDTKINLHFVCFIVKDGNLYELDGGKTHPINHGPATEATILQDAKKVIQEVMALNPAEQNFCLTALTAAN